MSLASRTQGSPTSPFRGLGADLRLALRLLGRQRWSTLSIVVTLALGIGASTAIYAAFNHVLFRPVAGVASGQFVRISFETTNRLWRTSPNRTELPALREAARAAGMDRLADSCCGSQLAISAPAGAPPSFERTEFVTSQYFSLLGVKTRIGRLLTDDEADGGAEAAVISDRLWRTAFGSRADAVGAIVNANGHAFFVVGVTEAFRGWGLESAGGDTDVWLPIGSERAVTGSDSWMGDPIARLPGGQSLATVATRLRVAYARLPLASSPRFHDVVPFVEPGLFTTSAYLAGTTGQLYWVSMAAVALVLVLACANAANLLLARAGRRERDTAVRLAVGGSRWRITRQFLIEALGMSGLAAGLGLLAAALIVATMRSLQLSSDLPETTLRDMHIDGRVALFCVSVAAATVLLFGLLPAVAAARADVRGVLGRAGRGVASPHRLRRALVVLQVALSLTLVAGAGVLNRSLQHLLTTNLGMNLDHVIDLELKPYLLGYSDRQARDLVAVTADSLKRAGFQDVAVSYPDPLTRNSSDLPMKTATMPTAERQHVLEANVSPAFFRVLGIPLSGRTFSELEQHEADSVEPMPVILSGSLAHDLFGGGGAVGRTFEVTRYSGAAALPTQALVIGVAGDTLSGAVRGGPRAAIYTARDSSIARYGAILVRSPEPIGTAMARIRSVVRDVDPAQPIAALRPLRDEVADDLSEDRLLARLGAILALIAAGLAGAGVASVISQLVVERTRDFGIRSALGASAADILGHVLSGVITQSAIGVALGVALYWWASRWLASRLYGLGALDPFTIGLAIAVVFAIALAAAAIPGRRAARIDPVVALRAE